MSKQLVIIPTYNEIPNIEAMVRTVFALPDGFDILVVDDGSPDGTADKVLSLQEEYRGKLFLEKRNAKTGLGTAYIHGFKWALDRQYDFIFEMDCDFSHPPSELSNLLKACQSGADVSIGSRYCKGGKIKNWPWDRIIMSYVASLYVRLILWLPVKDTTAGFVCYRRSVLEQIDLHRIQFVGYAFQIEMKYRAFRQKFRLQEVPITFTDRLYGESKMSGKIFKEAIIGVLKMRFIGLN